MAALRTLVVQLTAKTGKFKAGMKSSTRHITAFGRRTAGARRNVLAFSRALAVTTLRVFAKAVVLAATKVAMLSATLAGIALGGTFIYSLTNAIKRMDRLSKTSEKLGISVKMLSRLEHAAETVAVDIKQLETGMQRMTRRASEAGHGTGEAKAAIAELGQEAKKFAALSPDKQILELADAFARVETQGDKVRLMFKLFDTEGVNMIRLMALGREGILKLFEESDKLGRTITDLEAKTAAMVVDAFNRLKAVFEGISNTLAVQLIPLLESLADRFVNAATESRDLGNTVTRVMEAMTVGIAKAVDKVNLLRLAWHAWRGQNLAKLAEVEAASLERVDAQLERHRTVIRNLARLGIKGGIPEYAQRDINELIKQRGRHFKKIEELRHKINAHAARALELSKQTSNETKIIAQFEKLRLDMAERAQEVLAQAGAAPDLSSVMSEEQRLKGVQIFEQTRTPMEQYQARLEELQGLLNVGAISADTFERAIQQAQERLGGATKETTALTDALDKLHQSTGQFKQTKMGRVAMGISAGISSLGGLIGQAGSRQPRPRGGMIHLAHRSSKGYTPRWIEPGGKSALADRIAAQSKYAFRAPTRDNPPESSERFRVFRSRQRNAIDQVADLGTKGVRGAGAGVTVHDPQLAAVQETLQQIATNTKEPQAVAV